MSDEITTLSPDSTKLSLTANTLKYIAIIFMVIDHTTCAFIPEQTIIYIIIRFFTRIAAPVFFFAAVEGYHHTKNVNRYMIRLAVFTLISYLPFIYYESGGVLAALDFSELNVIFTIFLGITAIRVRRELKNPVLKILLILSMIVLSITADWGITGVLIILVFDYFYGDFKNQAIGYCMIVLLQVGLLNKFISIFYIVQQTHSLSINLSSFAPYIINTGMFIPIILLRFYNGRKGRSGKFTKWFFYIFYPFHLLILGILQGVFK